MKTGLIFGKFMPLHNGHINFINTCSTLVDKLYVVLSYDQKVVDDLSPFLKQRLGLENRFRWLLETYKDIEHIEVMYIDETNIPEYPNGWVEWSTLLKNKFKENNINFPDVVFSSEPGYTDGIEKYLGCEHYIYDTERKNINISATEIRKDLFKNWEYIPSIVRKDFVLKVCVTGSESCGKTTLVKFLAKNYNTSWTDEYGRTFVEDFLHGHESLLTKDNYETIIIKHYEQIKNSLLSSNKILIVDTDCFVTKNFYQHEFNEENELIESYCNNKNNYFDLYLFLEPDTKWIDDGIRIYKDDNERQSFSNNLKSLYEEKNIHLKTITGSYHDRLTKSIEKINTKLKTVIGE